MDFNKLLKKIADLDTPVNEHKFQQGIIDRQAPPEDYGDAYGHVRTVEDVLIDVPQHLKQEFGIDENSEFDGADIKMSYSFDHRGNVEFHDVIATTYPNGYDSFDTSKVDVTDAANSNPELKELLHDWIQQNDVKNYDNAGDLYESTVEECAECDAKAAQHPAQQDSVNATVNINGQGAGGIRDLLKILSNLEDKSAPLYHDAEDDILLGADKVATEPEYDDENILDDDYGNSAKYSSGPIKYNVSAVTRTGNDLASKGLSARKENGGSNPFFNLDESLLGKLQSLYTEVKTR